MPVYIRLSPRRKEEQLPLHDETWRSAAITSITATAATDQIDYRNATFAVDKKIKHKQCIKTRVYATFHMTCIGFLTLLLASQRQWPSIEIHISRRRRRRMESSKTVHFDIVPPSNVTISTAAITGNSTTLSTNFNTSDAGATTLSEAQVTIKNVSIRPGPIAAVLPRTDNLKLAMLISFPNSGTSFTLSTVRITSKHHIGSTSCLVKNEERTFIPVYTNLPQHGPHYTPIHLRAYEQLTRPQTYILTKTHCEGYDNSPTPNPRKYIVSPTEFETGCRRTCSPVVSSFEEQQQPMKLDFFYFDASRFGSFVHLFRDPFDNIVSRWHNHIKGTEKGRHPEEVNKWEKSPSGFQAFCRERDDYHRINEAHYFSPELLIATEGVPCRTDFLRYVQWHNNAFQMTHSARKPIHILHYLDYRNDYNGTISKLLHFLELPLATNSGLVFQWRNYSDYFTQEQRNAAKNFIKLYASSELLHELARYGFGGEAQDNTGRGDTFTHASKIKY